MCNVLPCGDGGDGDGGGGGSGRSHDPGVEQPTSDASNAISTRPNKNSCTMCRRKKEKFGL